jgi:uracil-DNA glycosylase family 4
VVQDRIGLFNEVMADAYQELLEATIHHLKGLKARGTRFVTVSPEALASLSRTPSPKWKPAIAGRPAPVQRMAPAAPITSPPPKPIALQKMAAVAPAPASSPKVEQEPAIMREVPSPGAKTVGFASLRQRAMACVKCSSLAASRKNVVFGVGSLDAELMFVGEAPGADEDLQGEPFVGKAGQLLTKIIQTMGLTRERVYIANILKCRPDTPGQTAGNRKPTPQEMETCIPYLHEQIDLIRPKVLVGLGGTAMEGLLGKSEGIMRLRGKWQTYRGIPLMPTYHPAYVLRKQSPVEKRQVWEDMLQVMEKLGMPISEKQRGFFRTAA